jgi:hypothetical protein
MEIDAKARDPKYKDVTFLLVNLANKQDADKFLREKGLSGGAGGVGAVSLVGRPGAEYGLKYIPHKVLIDRKGNVVSNFKLDWGKLDEMLL